MKQFYLILITFFAFSFAASAQVILYHENFTATNLPAGVSSSPANAWYSESSSPSTLPQSSKGKYARTSELIAGEKRLMISVSTLGYSKATIMWEQFRNTRKNNFPLDETVELQYSVGAGTPKTFYTAKNLVNGSWNKENSGRPIELPNEAMGLPDVRIYWKINLTVNNTNSEYAYYAIDDITVMGTPETGVSTFNWSTRPVNEDPFVVSGATATAPYTVDGITMRWSAAVSSSAVKFETAKVDDKNFKAGTKSLTLIQTGATSATAGSTIQLDLNQPVEDLTFTIFDVDVAAGQFIDNLVVTGYYNGKAVALTRNKVITTSYNQLSGTTITGLASSDNASAEGDVTLSFPQPVTRVIIQYKNGVTNPTNSGRQGIAIHNLTWRKEQGITVLPVELASFKGVNQNGAAKLLWSTASEKNNDRFEVERSQDGKNFTKIGEVTGNGTSNIKLSYNFIDASPVAGTNYYRLRQVDFDGTSSFSKTVSVTFAATRATTAMAQVYPTIAAEQVTINLASATARPTIVVLDATGKVVMQYAQVADHQLVVPVQQLQNGMYFVHVTDGASRETHRFLKN
ncbi:MAG TPA: T9SS type A sorting domain-containing protein [Pontibacter sp.]